ncbi:hypothetical protein DBR37_03315 [Herminiimonas sp. KBW02]|nr:hypothetical protein DBR37_03315 [Herminiimonas sp. KBW02]
MCFHGTDEATAEKILAGKDHLDQSTNQYDWLGHGIYFWEYSPHRAQEFVETKFAREKRKDKVAVVGAIIDPGLCLNLLDASGLKSLELAYEALLANNNGDVAQLPVNGTQRWNRNLDCAVINMLHELREVTQQKTWQKKNPGRQTLPAYDTVRGAFWEGGPIFPGSLIEKKNHVQICVRNPDVIKAYFRPIQD